MAGYVQKVQPHPFRLRIGRALGRLPKPHQPVPQRPSETAACVRARNRRNTRPRPAGNHCFACVSQSPRTRQGRTQRRLLPRSPKGHYKRDGGQQQSIRLETRKKLEALAFVVSHNLYYVNLTNITFCKMIFSKMPHYPLTRQYTSNFQCAASKPSGNMACGSGKFCGFQR